MTSCWNSALYHTTFKPHRHSQQYLTPSTKYWKHQRPGFKTVNHFNLVLSGISRWVHLDTDDIWSASVKEARHDFEKTLSFVSHTHARLKNQSTTVQPLDLGRIKTPVRLPDTRAAAIHRIARNSNLHVPLRNRRERTRKRDNKRKNKKPSILWVYKPHFK